MNGDKTVYVALKATYTDAGVTITDDKDTDLVPTITYTKDGVEVDKIDTTVSGTYVIHYNVSDAEGNKATEVTRTVVVEEPSDTTAPAITLNGDPIVYINGESAYSDAGVTITDDKDTDLVPTITYTKDGTEVDSIDTAVEGTYIIHYNVSDSAGNKAAEVTRTVVVDKTPPVITLNGDAKITIIAFSTYIDQGATATDNIDAEVTITDDSAAAVDITKAGTYTVTYTATDDASNTATVSRTVIVMDKMSDEWKIISITTNRMTTGATEYTIVSKNKSDWTSTSYFCEADITGDSNIKVLSNYGKYDASNWRMTTLSEQARAAQAYFDKTPGYENYKVIGILVGDTFNMSTGEPTGALVMSGIKYHNAGSRPYFAILKDGTAVIRDGNVSLDDCESAVGGIDIILRDGKIISNPGDYYSNIMYSRAAIGVKKDGTVVTMATKGFDIPDNYGLTFDEVASHLKAMGCVDVLMLDGGGSAQWSSMYEGTDDLIVRNNPSDGHERSVSSSILIVSVATSDGEFNHANITPKEEVYTPDSTVAFSAVGVDGAGNPADIPEGATWALADNIYGTIDEEGTFTSNKKTGDVTVQMLYKGKIVGEATVTIAVPDTITFTTSELNIGRGKESDLGLTALYNGKSVNYKAGDFIWTLSDETMGTVNNETNTFKASSDVTTTGTVTVTSIYDQSVSGSIKVNVGQEPTLVMDFEDYVDEDGTETPSYDYWGADENGRIVGRKTGNTYLADPTGKLTTLFYNRGGKESAEIVSRADGYPVHSGTYALKLNYDMSKATGTEGANIGMTENFYIPGYPTGLGLWVYVPESTPNLWLRTRLSIVDEEGNVESTTQYDYTEEIKNAFPNRGSYGGLDDVERGTWKLLIMDLSKYAGSKFMIPAGETIRLMWTRSNALLTSKYNPRTDVTASHGIYLPDGTTIAQKDCVGSIYVDDFMFIYGSINEDTKAPTINYLNANDENMSEGMAFNTNTISFRAMFKDEYDEDNLVDASGIDFDNVYMYIDGQLMKDAVKDLGGMIGLDGVKLANGEHSVKLLITDKNGNERIATYSFVINAADNTATKVQLVARQDIAALGGKLDLDVVSDEVSNIDFITTTLKIDSKYKDSYTVTAGDGYTVDGDSISYNDIHNTVAFTVNRNSDAVNSGEGTIATISFEISKDIANGSYFTYSVDAGNIRYANNYAEDNLPSFSSLKYQLPVGSAYLISSDVIVAGMHSGYFYVKNADGNPVPDATLYFSNGTEVGQTDSEGKVKVPDSILENVTEFEVYAKDSNGNISFTYTGQSYAAGGAADGSPIHILNNAASNGSTMRNLSWISNPLHSKAVAKVQISDSEAGIENGTIYTGTSKLMAFMGSANASANYAARINGVTITELTPGAIYYYRVGDGETWSAVDSFTMPTDDNDTNMFILGDIQANDETNIKTILNELQKDGASYDLGIQTGDAVDFASSYSYWTDALGLMDMFKNNQTMLHVIGNHEETGESGEEITSAVYNLQNPSYYSVDYGLVYVATIKFMDSMNAYEEALDWLVDDAAKSDAPYKILVMHQPAYYTNASDPSNARLHELLPKYAKDAGIDIVFAGHDHSYARTQEINGVVYYICGTSGEKSYPVTVNDDFNFVKATDEFTAIYITLNATDEKLTVTTYDLVDGVPTVYDTYTKPNN